MVTESHKSRVSERCRCTTHAAMDIHETTDAIVQLSKPYGFIIIDEAVHM